MARKKSAPKTIGILQHINAPLGFYVLSLLVIESTLALVLAAGGLDRQHKWIGFLCMIGVFVLVILVVTGLVIWAPKNLVFGKEEHAVPLTDPSALKDQIEDLVVQNVKAECLKSPER